MKTIKHTFFILLLFLNTFVFSFAQAPQKVSYQSIIRNTSGELVQSQPVGIRISILQGSATGTAVYIETHTPATNVNGLASVEVGNGTPVSGTFSNIKWGDGFYFLKLETDPSGGTNYTIIGTTEILSVPYALHAKTAETVTGGITETDPVFNAWDKDYEDLINRPAAVDGSETKVTAGSGITLSGAGTTASPYIVSVPPPVIVPPLAIGDSYQGGKIFWIDNTGKHGLIAATSDQIAGVRWNNGTNRYTGAANDGLYAGSMNTSLIVATQIADNQTGNFAAKVCADYSVTVGGVTYGDWYLPSLYELKLLYQQKNLVGGFANAWYWSSTEANNEFVFVWYFGNNGTSLYDPKSLTYNVRAIRAF